jgi:adenylyl- and sulfurtransferase ThiI
VSYSHATETKPVLEEIASAATVLATGFSARTRFRVTTKRMDKGFALTSMQVDRLIGELVAQGTGARVSLEGFDSEIGIEILKHNAFVFSERNYGFGGLPLGISGRAVGLIEDVKGIVASWLMMKRGVVVYPVSFKPTDISVLQKYSYGCNISLRTIGTLREVESYMEQIDARALVVGQTLDKFSALPIQKMVVRPLVGYGSKEILELYGKIE